MQLKQEDLEERKTINGWNDSVGTRLFFLPALLQQHPVSMLTVLNAGFFADLRSADMAKIAIERSQICLGREPDWHGCCAALCQGAG